MVQPADRSQSNTIRGGERHFAQTNTKPEITEAQGWIVNDRGNLELVAQKTDTNNYLQSTRRSRLPKSLNIEQKNWRSPYYP